MLSTDNLYHKNETRPEFDQRPNSLGLYLQNHPTNQPPAQTTTQQTTQPANKKTNQTTNEPTNNPTSHLKTKPTNQPSRNHQPKSNRRARTEVCCLLRNPRLHELPFSAKVAPKVWALVGTTPLSTPSAKPKAISLPFLLHSGPVMKHFVASELIRH